MNHHVENTLEKTKSRSIPAVKDIRINEKSIPLPVVTYAKNTAVGMALSYIERAEIVFMPVIFVVKHLGTLFAAALHIILPIMAAWFASHWNAQMEVAVWSGSSLSQAISFMALWMFGLASWSIVWLTFATILGKIKNSWSSYARHGETYLAAQRENRHKQEHNA